MQANGRWGPSPQDLQPYSQRLEPDGLLMKFGRNVVDNIRPREPVEIEVAGLDIHETLLWPKIKAYTGDAASGWEGTPAAPGTPPPEPAEPELGDSKEPSPEPEKKIDEPGKDEGGEKDEKEAPAGPGADEPPNDNQSPDEPKNNNEDSGNNPTRPNRKSMTVWLVAGAFLAGLLAGLAPYFLNKNWGAAEEGLEQRVEKLRLDRDGLRSDLRDAKKTMEALRRAAYGPLKSVFSIPGTSPEGITLESVIADNPALAARLLAAKAESSSRPAERAYWLKQAAMRGHAGALLALSSIYAKGQGVHRDLNLAFQLARLADVLGAAGAKPYLKKMLQLGKLPGSQSRELIGSYDR